MMNICGLDDVFRYFESRTNLEKGLPAGNPNRVYRLDRMNALCDAFDRPQDRFRVIHVAGSKGKGSTTAMIAALLSSAGRRIGAYLSPHLTDYRERFHFPDDGFPETAALDTALKLLERLPALERSLPGDGPATTFELLTLFGFLLFLRMECDTVVLETGLGGRLDATNVVSRPEAVVFTPIEKEHTEILGRTIRRIASEKAGILKSGSRAWSAAQRAAAGSVFIRRASRLGVQIEQVDRTLVRIDRTDGMPDRRDQFGFHWNLRWRDGGLETIRLAMGGKMQAWNAALALRVARTLERSPGGRSETASGNGAGVAAGVLSSVSLPGRFQILGVDPLTVIDGAHTPRSVEAVADAFAGLIPESAGKPLLLFGSVADKDHRGMARRLCRGGLFPEVIVSTPGTFKSSDPRAVAESFRRAGADVSLLPDPSDAWLEILARCGGRRPILVTGSFYMAGEIARIVRTAPVSGMSGHLTTPNTSPPAGDGV